MAMYSKLNIKGDKNRKLYFSQVTFLLIMVACYFFAFLNYYMERPILVGLHNLLFGVIFSIFLLFRKRYLDKVLFVAGLCFQAYIFGHAYYLLPGKQVEDALGIFTCLLPVFFSGRQMWFFFVGNLILYHIVLFGVAYPSVFYFKYIFYFNVFLIMRAVLLENRKYEKALVVQRDKIERDAERLREADELKTRFFANISHELRTPLTLILGPAENLSKQNYSKERQQYYGKFIRNNAKTLLNRIDDLLALSKMDAKRLKIYREAIELNTFLQITLANFESYALQKGVHLKLEQHIPQPLYVEIDVQKVSQILSNLLTNAIKFTPKDGTINLMTIAKKDHIQFSVSDTGIGIASEDLERIFDRFYQSAQERTYQGTGIGLALCKELAELMQGEIWAESEQGKGSVFHLKLPKIVAKQSISTSSTALQDNTHIAPSIKALPKQSTCKILVVEDNEALRQFIVGELQEHQVLQAANGKEAIELLQKEHFQLIISDIMMPEMDGFELLQQLKSKTTWQNIPIIMLTARNEKQDRLAALRIGVDDYLIKPFDTDELKARIHNLILRYEQRTQATITEQTSDISEKSDTPKWLQEFEQFVLSSLTDSRLSLDWLAAQQHISKRQLQRRIKKATGMTVFEYIRELRFHQARQLLENKTYSTIHEVIQHIGLKDSTHFSNLYFERFGKRPLEYLM
ncbi:MAG: ATP-binding protein [Bacteroidota bacterium]